MRVELFSRLIRYRRAVVLGALAAVSTAAWAYLFLGAGIDMDPMVVGGGQAMAMPPEWSPPYMVLIFVMWGAMMVAMMLPIAVPTVLLVTTLAWDRTTNPNLVPAMAMLFALGYLIVWCGFSLVAALSQWGLSEASLLSETMAFGDTILAGTVLIAAGVYQWTPLKDACLRHCRSPTEFLIRHWRESASGAVQTGIRHGLFCLGCCWMLMALLFVGGLMNLAWAGTIAVLVLLERTMPWGDWMSRFTGVLLIVWGAASLVRIICNETCYVSLEVVCQRGIFLSLANRPRRPLALARFTVECEWLGRVKSGHSHPDFCAS